MNVRTWFHRERTALSRVACVVWGKRSDLTTHPEAPFVAGTGVLIMLRGTGLIATCHHVLAPIGEPMVTTSRLTVQTRAIDRERVLEPTLDLGAIVLNDAFEPGLKTFVAAQDAYLGKVDTGTPVLLYGFPVGHKSIGSENLVDERARVARFRSMTYLSVTEYERRNSALARWVPTIEWTPKTNRDSRRFEPLPIPKGDIIDRHGFSGGPVFLASERRLIGHVTHVDESSHRCFYYVPISETLEYLDKRLNLCYELCSGAS